MLHTFLTSQNSILIIILAVLVLALIGWIIHLELRLKKFLIGVGTKNIDDSFAYIDKNLKDMAIFRKELEAYLKMVEVRLRQSVQGVETVRFNPFKGIGEGGNQSFATAFINEEGDGVILSSLYSRERVSIFSKPIKKLTSEFELTKEELDALAQAKRSLSRGK
jgi:hypothetical protein